MVDAQVSGTCGGSPVKVRVFSRAPSKNHPQRVVFFDGAVKNSFSNFLRAESLTTIDKRYGGIAVRG